MSFDLSHLLSPDNATRNAAEQALDQLQQSNPSHVALHLVDSLSNPVMDPMVRELCAVLLRRRLPIILPSLSTEWRDAVKAKLLKALTSDCDAKLRRKVCDTVGRLGVELVTDGNWPELMEFVRSACASGVPAAHETALTVLSHMAPALVEPRSWAAFGQPLQALLLGAINPANGADSVNGAALCALAALLQACAEQERDTDSAADRKKLKGVASDLQGALPAMLSVLEAAVSAADPTRITTVLESLSQVAAAQPRLFKGVLPVVVDGMGQLATSAALQLEARISCAELLLTLAEGAPKMCAKLEAFAPRVLSVLLPMLVRLGGDVAEWDAAEPEDGLFETDNDDDEEKEAAYAAEALDRLCEAVGGEAVTTLLLPQLQGMLAEGSPWTGRHAALIAIATVCEHGSKIIEPHLDGILDLVRASAGAPEARLRWATFYSFGLLCDEFAQLGEKMYPTLVSMVTAGMADASPRVRAAAALATTNLVGAMQEPAIVAHAQGLLGGVHSILASPASAGYVVYAAAATLAVISDELSDAPSKPMGSAYSAFMPHLTSRIEPAIAARQGRLSAELLHAIGKLAASAAGAAGAEQVSADVAALVPSIASLLARKEVSDDRTLMRGVHTTLTSLAAIATASFMPVFEQLLPGLLHSAAVEVDIQLDRVEQEDPAADERDDGWEVEYHQNKGKGLIKLRVNAFQMDEKLLALDALFSYAKALGGAFHPAVSTVISTCLPLLAFKWSPKVRVSAAMALAEAYKCVVLAAADGAMTGAHVTELAGVLFKPFSEQLAKEDNLEAADALLDGLREVLVLERTHAVGALSSAALNQLIQMVKRQLQLDETRMRERAAAAAEEDEEDEEDDEDEQEHEAELLTTCAALTTEVLHQHGEAALPQVEAQLLLHMQPWLAAGGKAEPTDREVVRLALGIDVVAAAIEHTGKEASKKYVSAILPLLTQHVVSKDSRLRVAAILGLGVVAEHGGKLFSRGAATNVAKQLLAMLAEPDARYSVNIEASEAAVTALGKMLVHRGPALDAAAALPVWLSWLPLRYSEEPNKQALGCLCKLLEADANAVFGVDGGRFPLVLGAMAAAYESEAAGEAISGRMKSLVQQWAASNQATLQSGTAMLTEPHLREKVGRMATA